MSKVKKLDINSPDFVSELRKDIGAKDGDEIRIITPQFERVDGFKVDWIPQNKKEFDFIKTLCKEEAELLGVAIWSYANLNNGQSSFGEYVFRNKDGDDLTKDTATFCLMLFPGEWYDAIPEGYQVIDISGQKENFVKGVTDDDIRFGALPYGVMVTIKKEKR